MLTSTKPTQHKQDNRIQRGQYH